jgi:hypothetical protein
MSGLPADLYGRARLLGAPGVEATIRLNPTGWSTRMRNAVVKALRAGVMPGGYRSKVQQTTELILKSRQLRFVRNDGWCVSLSEPLAMSPEAHKQAVQILKTDYAAARLGGEASEYRLRDKKERIDNLENSNVIGDPMQGTTYFMLGDPLNKEFADLIASNIPEWEIKERNNLADDIVAYRTITIQE